MGQQMLCLVIIYHYSLLCSTAAHSGVPAPLLELLISIIQLGMQALDQLVHDYVALSLAP